MSSTEPTSTYGETSGTRQTSDDAGSAAERLGGPMEDEQSPDTARRAEADADRQAETVAGEDEQSVDTARRAETDVDRQAETVAGEDDQSVDTARQGETDSDRQAETVAAEGEQADTARQAGTDTDRAGDTVAAEDEQSVDTARQAEPDADRQGDADAEQRTTLIAPERAESYDSRWKEIKIDFVDEPRRAVRGANELVGEVLDELEELFRSQRADLEQGLDSEETTTEDLRLALGRYRSFFDRLLTF
jgi:hypothetical protein